MMKKKVIKEKNMWEGPFNVENIVNAKPIYIIETKTMIFKANNINLVFLLWESNHDGKDIISFEKLG